MTSTENPTNTFEVEASEYAVKATMSVATAEQAAEIVAAFPKSARLRATTLTCFPGTGTVVFGYVQFSVAIASNGVNGGRNETGIKRYQTFRRAAEKLGYPVVYNSAAYVNSLTDAEFEAAVAV